MNTIRSSTDRDLALCPRITILTDTSIDRRTVAVSRTSGLRIQDTVTDRIVTGWPYGKSGNSSTKREKE
jgi:hypothetical protein